MFFSRRPKPLPPLSIQKIEVFIRYCNYSSVSAHKKRPLGFSYPGCRRNLLATLDSRVRLTSFLDVAREGDHFVKNEAIEIHEGTEAGSFLRMVDYVEKLDLHPDTIVYFLEDDYLHRPGWVDILFEGFSTGADYVTLYDHRDKYTLYPNLRSALYITRSSHWRTTPSTTNTYAMRFSTFQRDIGIHRRFSLGRKVSRDHDKFCFLAKKGAVLVSPIPGFSTHADIDDPSPCIDWNPFY